MTHPDFIDRWQDRVRESGWHAWRFVESKNYEVYDIQWFDIEQQGSVPMVVFFIAGYGQKQPANKPLAGVVVCPVQISLS